MRKRNLSPLKFQLKQPRTDGGEYLRHRFSLEQYCSTNSNIDVNDKMAKEKQNFLQTAGAFEKKENFEIDAEVLGRGSQGSLYKAIHTDSKFTLCFKTCNTQVSENEKRQILNEVQIMYEFINKNIMETYGCFFSSTESLLYISMPLMDPGSLEKVFANKKPTEKCLGKLAVAITDALHFLHAKKIIHNDIKPQNVLINYDHEIKLADFGCIERCSENFHIPNTAKYAAPLAAHHEGDQKIKKDIWSMGITLIEVFTTKFPFEVKPEDSVMEIQAKVNSLKSVSLPDCSAEFANFLTSCLAIEAEDRAETNQLMNKIFYTESMESSWDEYQQWITNVKQC